MLRPRKNSEVGEAHKMTTGDNVTALHRMDTVFAKMTQVLPGLDLLTKKMVDTLTT